MCIANNRMCNNIGEGHPKTLNRSDMGNTCSFIVKPGNWVTWTHIALMICSLECEIFPIFVCYGETEKTNKFIQMEFRRISENFRLANEFHAVFPPQFWPKLAIQSGEDWRRYDTTCSIWWIVKTISPGWFCTCLHVNTDENSHSETLSLFSSLLQIFKSFQNQFIRLRCLKFRVQV